MVGPGLLPRLGLPEEDEVTAATDGEVAVWSRRAGGREHACLL